jgi:hypothetical protein
LHCAKSNSTVKKGIFRDFGVAEAPQGFQAGWSDCMYFFSLSFCSSCPLIWVFRVSFVLMMVHCRFEVRFALCKEQQHSQKHEFFIFMIK